MPKVWCRDDANQFGVFEAHDEQCHATYAIEAHRKATNDEATRAATLTHVRFKPDHLPDLLAGLDVDDDQ